MANKDLKLTPHTSASGAWWYEESDGIHILVPHSPKNTIEQCFIPWRSLEAAIKRKRKPKNKGDAS